MNNLVTLGLGGALFVTLGLEAFVPTVYAAIPSGAESADRNRRHATSTSIRAPSVSDGIRTNSQTSRRRN